MIGRSKYISVDIKWIMSKILISSSSVRFAWGLLPNYPQKGEAADAVEPADIIIR